MVNSIALIEVYKVGQTKSAQLRKSEKNYTTLPLDVGDSHVNDTIELH